MAHTPRMAIPMYQSVTVMIVEDMKVLSGLFYCFTGIDDKT
jgi:hypothetical protein